MIFRYLILVLGIAIGLGLSNVSGQGSITESRKGTFILADDIGKSYQNYEGLIDALDNARPGQVIEIVLYYNHGGYMASLEPILEAMKNTKGITHTYVKGYASSCALRILFAGQVVHIPKQAFIGVDHLAYIGTYDNKIRPFFMVKNDIQRLQGHKRFETAEEFQRVVSGDDVALNGHSVCKVAKPAIESPASCVIRQ